MAQPKEPPLSIRLPPALLASVDEWAATYRCSRHAAVVRLIGAGLGGDAGMMAAYAAEVGKMVTNTGSALEPRLEVIKSRAAPLRLPRAPVGSLLKKPAKGK